MRSKTTRSADVSKSEQVAEPVLADGVWIGAAVARGRDALTAAGCGTPRLDAELLLAEAMSVGRERLVIDRDQPLDPAAAERFAAMLARRAAREPVAYILGRREFRYLTLAVDRRVLIPRPETELLVEVGLGLAPGAVIADVGTGSGAVALALKHERPDLVVRGSDVSTDALDVARENAARLGLDVQFAAADLLDSAPCDAVLANLPYVARDAVLEPEIASYEPPGALFAGADGLDLIRRLITDAGAVAAGGGLSLLALEVAPDQAAEVAGLLQEAGFSSVQIRRDLAGLDRVVVGSR
jgi:release factor glutamine methyltransferase